ncbi:uncharacterized protein TRAVEDRAFT_52268 [Trametes versicolor FP-101664 SS1]|uniref:uncharacterized protein n=1 Tax=Trametes versicolor (strain FP-101664) TaxID=717944 RepID=UPI0004623CD4|nr:uncharacterized protein TRAVEDRAFT_52268 [Trametes versicolor FP-101664 SS1]EIW54574.1 hypothetical protein TRAVEDRAFT_52268 [Trametes versicolor FP-101664 SS1]
MAHALRKNSKAPETDGARELRSKLRRSFQAELVKLTSDSSVRINWTLNHYRQYAYDTVVARARSNTGSDASDLQEKGELLE